MRPNSYPKPLPPKAPPPHLLPNHQCNETEHPAEEHCCDDGQHQIVWRLHTHQDSATLLSWLRVHCGRNVAPALCRGCVGGCGGISGGSLLRGCCVGKEQIIVSTCAALSEYSSYQCIRKRDFVLVFYF